MKTKLIIKLLFSIIGGLIITIITGLFPYPIGEVMGIERWGFPFYWLSRLVYPGAEKTINWSNLLINILAWSFIMFLIINLVDYIRIKFKHRKSNKKN
ncbi:MAG: hypothetical protein ACFE9X_07255 [Promethearchaeota archaeon]